MSENIIKPNNFYNQKQFFSSRVSKDKNKFCFIPTIILIKERDCGVQIRLWGFILCFAYWQLELAFGTLQEEMFNQKLNYDSFCKWFKNVYNKNLTKEQLIDFLERNKDMKIFIDKIGFQYHYPRILLGRSINQSLS